MIAQTAHFPGVSPETLYNAYLSSREHSAMTAGSRPASFFRPGEGAVAHGKEGDELCAFDFTGPDGQTQFSLTAKVLQLVPEKLIVLTWKNIVWNLALDPGEVTDLDSTVVLTFQKNIAGAEIQLVQVNVPDYKVSVPETGEIGSLSSIVNTHWSLLYWEPMRKYFQKRSEGDEVSA
ncbi:MAG: SRPBCC domain-containing protein [Ktedonobacteraceae bacterium]